MSERTAPPVPGPRLNPFAFPSETTLRFVLLVIFVLCGSATFYGEFQSASDQATKECISQVFSKLSKLSSTPAGDDRNAQMADPDNLLSLARCAALLQPQAVWKLGGMGLVVVAAAIIYGLYPTWKLTTGRFEPVSSSEPPELLAELQSIAQTAGLPVSLVFVWNPLAIGLPIVFGRRGRYYVALRGSFITRYFYGDRDAFRAVLLHELAHIHNGDVRKTYLTLSLWWAFIATTLAPGLFIFFWRLATLRWMDAAPLLLDGILWTSVIILSGLAVLRAREHYADVQASTWDQSSQMDRVLATLPSPVGECWRRYLRFHPDPKERRQVVEDPSRLFRLSFADAFGIGIAAWFVVEAASNILMPFVPRHASAAFVFIASINFIVPTVVFAFAIGAIGIGVWRSAFASLLKGDPPAKGTGWLAPAFVAGFFPGLIMLLAEASLESFREQPLPFEMTLSSVEIRSMAYILMLVGCLLVFRWISQAASAWFEVVLQRRSPRPILLVSVATALLLVLTTLATATYVVMFSFAFAPWREGGPSWIHLYGLAAGGPIVIGSLAVWAFPLAASWWRRQIVPGRLQQWVFLDGASPKIPRQEAAPARAALLTGIVMGLAYLLLWQSVYLRHHLPTEIGDGIFSAFLWLSAGTKSVFGAESFVKSGSATFFQALAAAIVAGRTRRLSAVYGLFAASVAGFIIVVGDHILSNVSYDSPAWVKVLLALTTMGQGAVVALPTVIVAAWVASVAHRLLGFVKRDPRSAQAAGRSAP